MAFDNNHNCYFYLNRKRCFLTLLFINCFIACIYYIYEQNVTYKYLLRNNSQPKTSPIKINKVIEFIKNTLENEYNQDDLTTFYNTVEKEFSLGLRCTRKKKSQPQTTTMNTNFTINNNITTTTTTIIRYIFLFEYYCSLIYNVSYHHIWKI